ncbi:hypothetical protein Nepgr_015470 [Nepenthes gracilis]|uniref:Uncharacterized protein n=1 Tax=Nepenthes gracilis TaxID=150966 RepID=A0AAD3SMY4_NEPGR|nr:hypothetical protein Nepgr_015470 [Nepenthes gracilis]
MIEKLCELMKCDRKEQNASSVSSLILKRAKCFLCVSSLRSAGNHKALSMVTTAAMVVAVVWVCESGSRWIECGFVNQEGDGLSSRPAVED